ncbi:MAG: hypothetical protein HRU19_16030 [Pseudobacteriovorax sp.]|nr:hypothetical protein [Pseudobacteriovorax sp.]
MQVSNKQMLRDRRLAKMLSIEWMGQTIASVCWIVSVFMYGLSSAGDYLQLAAGSAWFLANVAAVTKSDNVG